MPRIWFLTLVSLPPPCFFSAALCGPGALPGGLRPCVLVGLCERCTIFRAVEVCTTVSLQVDTVPCPSNFDYLCPHHTFGSQWLGQRQLNHTSDNDI